MTQLRSRWIRSPVLGGLIGLTGLIGLVRLVRREPRSPRPTGQELMHMTDADFAAFVGATGIATVTSTGLAPTDARGD